MITTLTHENTTTVYLLEGVNHLGESISRGFFSLGDAESFKEAWGVK